MQKSMKLGTFMFVLSAFSAPVLAQETTAPPPVCENDARFNAFDFWVGDWNVYSNDEARQFQGTNSIKKEYSNCLITETWQGAGGGGGGFSINYYNPVTDEWRQVWVANGYSIDYTGGLSDGGAMVLEGLIYGYRNNGATPFRGIWTPEPNGDVIQHFDIRNAEGEWQVWFEGRYVRQETDPNPPHKQ